MDFRVLGALEVWNGDERVEISGRLHPKILAGLLLNAGRTVSVSWLVDLLWDDDPPATARRQVQNAVAALRRRLELVREGLIERVGQEYRVNIADEELDLRRFEKAVREARRFAESSRWDDAFDGFDSALALWRGPAFKGFSGRATEAAAARLDDKYLCTYEEYAETALVTGHAEQIVGRLQELIAENPLRQRLTGRLMHALHQANRTSEALRHFETLRDRLANELGLDPGEELKVLQVRILHDDPSLLPQSASSQHSTMPETHRPVPAQLPTDVASFTGRADQLVALDRMRDSGARTGIVSAITGIGGIGKTALAVHWGHSRREDYPDGQLYINLRGFDEREPMTPHEAVSRLLRSLGCPENSVPSDLDGATNLYRSLLADKQMLLVLDNARTEQQVRLLLPTSPGSLALVTSRNRLPGLVSRHEVHQVELDMLSQVESVDLLTELLGSDALADIEITHQLAQLCGHLPLALRIVAANLIQNPDSSLPQVVMELSRPTRISQMAIEDDASANLTSVFDLSYRALSDNARHVFNVIGLIPGDDFSSDLAAAIAMVDIEVAKSACQELADSHLVDEYSRDRFQLHDLIRDYTRTAIEQQLSEQQKDIAVCRLINWHSIWSNLTQEEINNVIAIYDTYSKHSQIWKIANAFRRFATYGQNLDGILHRTEEAFETAKNRDNVEAEITILNALSIILTMRGSHSKGLDAIKQAASLLPHIDDVKVHGQTLGNLGVLLYDGGSPAESLPHLRRSLEIAIDSNERLSMVTRSANLGRAYRKMGKFRDAQDYLTRAIEIATEDNLPNYVASASAALASAHFHMGRYDDALATVTKALQFAEGTNSTRIIATANRILGWTYRQLGKISESLVAFTRAIEITQKEQRLSMQIEVFHDFAETYLRIGELDQARANLSSADALLQPESHRSVVGQHERICCMVFTSTGAYSRSVRHGRLSCEIFRHEVQMPHDLAHSLNALGQAHLGAGDPTAATSAWTEALEIFTRLEVPEAATLRTKLDALNLQ